MIKFILNICSSESLQGQHSSYKDWQSLDLEEYKAKITKSFDVSTINFLQQKHWHLQLFSSFITYLAFLNLIFRDFVLLAPDKP